MPAKDAPIIEQNAIFNIYLRMIPIILFLIIRNSKAFLFYHINVTTNAIQNLSVIFNPWPPDIRVDSGADSVCEQHYGVCSEISP